MTTEVFDAAVKVAKRVGYRNVTRKLLAAESGKSSIWLMNHYRLRDTLVKLTENATALGLEPGDRKADRTGVWRESDMRDIVDVAFTLVKSRGLQNVTRPLVAKTAGFSTGTITNYFGNMPGLLDAVMHKAIEDGDASVVMQGLAAGSAVARSAPDKLKRAAAKALDEPVKPE